MSYLRGRASVLQQCKSSGTCRTSIIHSRTPGRTTLLSIQNPLQTIPLLPLLPALILHTFKKIGNTDSRTSVKKTEESKNVRRLLERPQKSDPCDVETRVRSLMRRFSVCAECWHHWYGSDGRGTNSSQSGSIYAWLILVSRCIFVPRTKN